MAISANIFAKCAPAKGTNIKACGSVTLCQAIPTTADDLATLFQDGDGNYRVMDALFDSDFEIKTCEAPVNGLYDFLMANRVDMSHKVQTDALNSGLLRIRPFVFGKRTNPVNNEFWAVSAGESAAGGRWQVTVTSTAGVPFDVRSFLVGEAVSIEGVTGGGTATMTNWKVYSSSGSGDYGTVILTSQDAASNLDPDRIVNPVTGLLRRGVNNVSDYESFCDEATAYITRQDVPFWTQTSRHASCKSELYDEYRKLLLANNPYWKKYQDLDEVEKNRQLGADFQRKWVNTFFFQPPLPNQTVGGYTALEDIETAASSVLDVATGQKCIGKRANAVGVYQQMAECGRVVDLQGAQLNLPALLTSLYKMWRVRKGQGDNSNMIDLFTDSVTADKINTAMFQNMNGKLDDKVRVNMDMGGSVGPTHPVQVKNGQAEFGFYYRSYKLNWPAGLTINVISHDYFDDVITAAATVSAALANAKRLLWVLDFRGIYPGIIASNRVVTKLDPRTLQSIDSTYACTMKVPTEEKTLTSVTWTAVVECPAGNLILENFSSEVPEPSTNPDDIAYPPVTSVTTTTSAA